MGLCNRVAKKIFKELGFVSVSTALSKKQHKSDKMVRIPNSLGEKKEAIILKVQLNNYSSWLVTC